MQATGIMRFTQYPPDEQSTPHVDGVATSVKKLLSASGRYTSARVRLLLLETRLAAGDMKGALVLFIFALAGLLAGAFFLAVALVLWIARLFLAGDTALASGIIGGLLLGTAAFLIWRARRLISAQNLFPVTKAEFNLDKQWLHELPQKTHGPNGRL